MVSVATNCMYFTLNILNAILNASLVSFTNYIYIFHVSNDIDQGSIIQTILNTKVFKP